MRSVHRGRLATAVRSLASDVRLLSDELCPAIAAELEACGFASFEPLKADELDDLQASVSGSDVAFALHVIKLLRTRQLRNKFRHLINNQNPMPGA
jgi:hypothetical protein